MVRYGIDRVVLSTSPIFAPLRFLSYFNPWNWGRGRERTRGEAIRRVLEELGPIFVKFGQILSTRRDLLPDDIIEELAKLQDSVPPFSGETAKEIVEKSFQRPIRELFESFDLMPLASASIAQVHAAVLHTGQKVVVKVRRPRIEKNIRRDLGLLYSVADFTARFIPHGRRLKPREIVAEFERTLIDELDFLREAANASQLRRNFLSSVSLYVPEIIWEYTRNNVMVMERISGVPISNIAELNHLGVNLKKLAERGVEIFFTQVFRDSFFHADMHPGNIFVAKDKPLEPQYIAVDFGIMGSLSPTDQHYLAENFLGFFHRDYRRVAILHIESGWVPATTRVEEFESAIRCVCEPIFERPLKDISFAQLLIRLFQTASRFHMEVQPQLLLLQKTLLNIEGLGRQLYPDLDLWDTAKPFLERWIKQKYSIRGLLKKAWEDAPYWMVRINEMPDFFYQQMQQKKNNQQLAMSTYEITVRNKFRRRVAWKNLLRGVALSFFLILLLQWFYFATKNATVIWTLTAITLLCYIASLLISE
jgi:ubiquinone biosynthesis protein